MRRTQKAKKAMRFIVQPCGHICADEAVTTQFYAFFDAIKCFYCISTIVDGESSCEMCNNRRQGKYDKK